MSDSESSAAASSVERTPTASPELPEAIPEERVSIYTRKVAKFGRKIVRLRIGRTRETFAIHEELLCSSSLYFREKLQKGRKPTEGECSICHEEMDPIKKEIAFCSSGCGANIHYSCMKSWKEEKAARQEVVRCPLCRHPWPAETNEVSCACLELDVKAFECYNEWLYCQRIILDAFVGDSEDGENEKQMDFLVDAYLLGVQLRDEKFRNATLWALTEVFEDSEYFPSAPVLQKVFTKTTEPCQIRRFMVSTYVLHASPDWFEEDDPHEYPTEFMLGLTVALLRKTAQPKSTKEGLKRLRQKYCFAQEIEK